MQVTTPLIAKLLYAFGPVDAHRKPDLLHALGEILESYNLTDRPARAAEPDPADRRRLDRRRPRLAHALGRAEAGALRVEVALGHREGADPEDPHPPGRGHRRPRVRGAASPSCSRARPTRSNYEITRERSDVESAISAPLIHGERVLGVLNLSHSLRRGAFSDEDLDFVTRLAAIDAKIITRAEEYHRLLRDSARLRAQGLVREVLAEPEPLHQHLSKVCRYLAEELVGRRSRTCSWSTRSTGRWSLRGSSTAIDPLAAPLPHPARATASTAGSARERKPVVLSNASDGRLRLLRGAAAARARRADRAALVRGHARAGRARGRCARRSARSPTRSPWRARRRAARRCSWSARRPRPARSPSSPRGSARPRTRRSYTAR